jgi:hypothetical protein
MVEKLATIEAVLGSHSFAVMSLEQDTNAPLSLGNQSTAVADAVWPPLVLELLVQGETVNKGCSGVSVD